MHQTVDKCRCQLIIIEDSIPFTEFYICCNNQAAFFRNSLQLPEIITGNLPRQTEDIPTRHRLADQAY